MSDNSVVQDHIEQAKRKGELLAQRYEQYRDEDGAYRLRLRADFKENIDVAVFDIQRSDYKYTQVRDKDGAYGIV